MKHINKLSGRKQNVLMLSLVFQEIPTRLKWYNDQFKPSVVTVESAALLPQIVFSAHKSHNKQPFFTIQH